MTFFLGFFVGAMIGATAMYYFARREMLALQDRELYRDLPMPDLRTVPPVKTRLTNRERTIVI